MREFCVGDTNILVSKNAKICITPNANAKICVTPNPNPQRQHVEYRSQNVCVGHVDFMLFVLISFPVCSGLWALVWILAYHPEQALELEVGY